jgi:hypothetical protein
MSGGTFLGRPIKTVNSSRDTANGAGGSVNVDLIGIETGGTVTGYRFGRPIIVVALSAGTICTGAGGGGEEINVYAYNDGVAGTDAVFDPITMDMSSTGAKGERMETLANSPEEEYTATQDLLVRAIKDAGSYTAKDLWTILDFVEV